MRLIVNGEGKDLEADALIDVINHYNLDPKNIVVEHNRSIVKRDEFSSRKLNDDDRIEIVTVVGGG